MPGYYYKAIDKLGNPARGRLDASNEVDLELRLKRMGLDMITFRAMREGGASLAKGTVSRRDLIGFCFDLEQISRAGIPIVEGLRDLRDGTENPRFREMMSSILEDIEGGKMLSQGMATFPNVFGTVFVSLVRAGEQSGRVTEVFESLGSALKWQDELISQTRKLMIYPSVVLVVVMAVVLFLLTYVVPQVTNLLKTMGLTLPLHTRILIAISDFTIHYWYVVLAIPVVIITALTYYIKTNPKGGFYLDYVKLRLPVVGPILQKIILARFANFFALMYQSGITILDAIKTSEEIVGNRVIADGLQRAGQQINSGESMSEAFRNLGVFPPLVIRMLRVGENTGALDTALLNIGYFYTRDVREAIDKALKLLEPALTLVLGAVMALILFSVLMPIYDIFGKLQF